MYNRFGIWQSSPSAAPLEKGPIPVSNRGTDVKEGTTYLCIPLEMIPTDLALPCSLFVRIADRYVLFRQSGQVLTRSRAESLVKPSNGLIFVTLSDWNKLLHSLESVLIASQSLSTEENTLERGLRIRGLLVAHAQQVEQSKTLSPEVFAKVQSLADGLATVLYQDPTLSTRLLRRYQEPALYYTNHVVNVAIYAIAIAKKQDLPLDAAKVLALAALVHNVGNIMVPPELLFKSGELTPTEKHTVDSHILHGATLLQSLGAPKEVVLTAMQHHDRYDGQGTESRGEGEQIHLYARICSIADVYDAMTSYRPFYPAAMTGKQAVARMQEMRGKFDPKVLPMVGEDQD
ncbi:HD domain-containing protein [bacterium]|nr:HD domain-containing protein [bacterium]